MKNEKDYMVLNDGERKKLTLEYERKKIKIVNRQSVVFILFRPRRKSKSQNSILKIIQVKVKILNFLMIVRVRCCFFNKNNT